MTTIKEIMDILDKNNEYYSRIMYFRPLTDNNDPRACAFYTGFVTCVDDDEVSPDSPAVDWEIMDADVINRTHLSNDLGCNDDDPVLMILLPKPEELKAVYNLIEVAEDLVNYFQYHNKNLTKAQDDKIDALAEALRLTKLEGNL